MMKMIKTKEEDDNMKKFEKEEIEKVQAKLVARLEEQEGRFMNEVATLKQRLGYL